MTYRTRLKYVKPFVKKSIPEIQHLITVVATDMLYGSIHGYLCEYNKFIIQPLGALEIFDVINYLFYIFAEPYGNILKANHLIDTVGRYICTFREKTDNRCISFTV